VVHRKKKPGKETVSDFWREIGYPTPLSRYWEKSRHPSSPTGKSLLFCRSIDVYAAVNGRETQAGESAVGDSPPAGSPSRGGVLFAVGAADCAEPLDGAMAQTVAEASHLAAA
jgi:hypothetical protein